MFFHASVIQAILSHLTCIQNYVALILTILGFLFRNSSIYLDTMNYSRKQIRRRGL